MFVFPLANRYCLSLLFFLQLVAAAMVGRNNGGGGEVEARREFQPIHRDSRECASFFVMDSSERSNFISCKAKHNEWQWLCNHQ